MTDPHYNFSELDRRRAAGRMARIVGDVLLVGIVTVVMLIAAAMISESTADANEPMRKVERQRALASCFGPGLYGGNMANGETLQRSTVGIAHRTLPLGTRVTVSYNGRHRMVLVKDRGPAAGTGRSVDMTERLVRHLGVSGCGSWGERTIRMAVRA